MYDIRKKYVSLWLCTSLCALKVFNDNFWLFLEHNGRSIKLIYSCLNSTMNMSTRVSMIQSVGPNGKGLDQNKMSHVRVKV